MGPLVPGLIGNELNLIVALFIGILFGFILEQAGFSTTKKLVGLFYGYDFTVLRVFFTAGVVAMTGVIIFDHLGILDLSLIYINPTFLYSAIVGGLIMGLGFVIGGFCPGTSVCAAAIGKIDAIVFVAGSFLGVFIFAEGYPLWENLYKAENWGGVRVFETMGISQSLFALMLAGVALFAFWMVSIVENKVNGIQKPHFRITPYYIALASIGGFIMITAFVLNPNKTEILNEIENESGTQNFKFNYIDSDEFAYRILQKDKTMQIVDFRKSSEFLKGSFPKSVSLTIHNLFERDIEKVLAVNNKEYIFIAEDEETEKKSVLIANKLGYENIRILKGGLNLFNQEILNIKQNDFQNMKINETTYNFRVRASEEIPVLIQQNKNVKPVKKTTARAIGGC